MRKTEVSAATVHGSRWILCGQGFRAEFRGPRRCGESRRVCNKVQQSPSDDSMRSGSYMHTLHALHMSIDEQGS